uniref:Uncharacterized protein n=1 Tax=Corvus moneduloides TaxID=1196302 RepID=A0A8U7N169_CORMO
ASPRVAIWVAAAPPWCPRGRARDIGGFPSSNWCSYTVTRTVSCHVQNGTFLQRVFQGCRWPLACSGGSYRAVVRPLYRVAYRTLTALEWRCCPGHTGANCEEEAPTFLTLRDTGRPSSAPRRPLLHPTAFSGGSLPKPAGVGTEGWVPPTPQPVPPNFPHRVPELQPYRGADSPARHPRGTGKSQFGVRPPPPAPPGGGSPCAPCCHPSLLCLCQVARLAVAEPPTPAAPKGSTPGRGPEAGQLWGSPAARGSPGDDGKAG